MPCLSVFRFSLAIIQTLLSPFSEKFKVTPKGTSSDRYTYSWALALPLIAVLILTLFSVGLSVSVTLTNLASANPISAERLGGMFLTWFWGAYNLFSIGIALIIMLDKPNPDVYEWFSRRHTVEIGDRHQTSLGVTTRLSEVGAVVQLQQDVTFHKFVTLEIIEEGLTLQGRITRTDLTGVQIQFEQVSLPQYRRLVEMLFCRPGQWQLRQTPGELKSLWLLLKAF